MSAHCMTAALARTDIRGDDRLALLSAADNSGRVTLSGVMMWVGCGDDEAIALCAELERRGEFVSVDGEVYAPSLMETETAMFLLGICAGRTPSQNVKARVFARDGKKCRYCGCTNGPFQLDHVTPYSRGGSTSLANLVVSCALCNATKGSRTPEEMGWCL